MTTFGTTEVADSLKRLGQRALYSQPAMEQILGIFHQAAEKHWDEPIAPMNAYDTVMWKGHDTVGVGKPGPHKRFGGSGGDLRRSMTQELGGDGAIREALPGMARYGTSLWYAHFFQGTKHQPDRVLITVTNADARIMRDIMRDWILYGGGAATAAGLASGGFSGTNVGGYRPQTSGGAV